MPILLLFISSSFSTSTFLNFFQKTLFSTTDLSHQNFHSPNSFPFSSHSSPLTYPKQSKQAWCFHHIDDGAVSPTEETLGLCSYLGKYAPESIR